MSHYCKWVLSESHASNVKYPAQLRPVLGQGQIDDRARDSHMNYY